LYAAYPITGGNNTRKKYINLKELTPSPVMIEVGILVAVKNTEFAIKYHKIVITNIINIFK